MASLALLRPPASPHSKAEAWCYSHIFAEITRVEQESKIRWNLIRYTHVFFLCGQILLKFISALPSKCNNKIVWLCGHMYWDLCIKLPTTEQAYHRRGTTITYIRSTVYVILYPDLFSEQIYVLYGIIPSCHLILLKTYARHVSEDFNSLCINNDHITFSTRVQHAHKLLKFYH